MASDRPHGSGDSGSMSSAEIQVSWRLRLDLILSRMDEGQELRAVVNERGT